VTAQIGEVVAFLRQVRTTATTHRAVGDELRALVGDPRVAQALRLTSLSDEGVDVLSESVRVLKEKLDAARQENKKLQARCERAERELAKRRAAPLHDQGDDDGEPSDAPPGKRSSTRAGSGLLRGESFVGGSATATTPRPTKQGREIAARLLRGEAVQLGSGEPDSEPFPWSNTDV